jgi:ectoine utilization protein EutC
MKPLQIVSETAIRRIAGLDLAALGTIERAFALYAQGRAVVPDPIGMIVPERGGEVHAKTAFLAGSSVIALKIATGFYGNAKLGLSNSNGIIVLLNARTGEPVAVLQDNGYLTDLRTALAGAIAAKYLAPQVVETVAILGTGAQARYQLRALRLVRAFERVSVWGRSPEHAHRYAEEMSAEFGVHITTTPSASAAVRDAQLVVTTTPSRSPLLHASDLRPGMHITAMGSDGEGKQELAPDVLTRADRIVCDARSQCERLGELQHASNSQDIGSKLFELGAIIAGTAAGREHDSEITVCDLTGVGVQDTAIADYVYKRLP